jgi:uncharacterized protein (TIGR02001 family)
MKKLLSAAAAATALLGIGGMTSAAHAEATFSGNVAMTTDYVFRGLTQTDGPAIQGGFDYANGMFYAGAWGSNVNFGNTMELDLYAGVKPVTGPVSWDLGVVGYLYPGSDPSPTFDYVEFYAKPSIAVAEGFTLGGALYYSPDFTGETGSAYYVEGNASFAATKELSFSGAVGYQQVSDLTTKTKPGYFNATDPSDDNYITWNVGGTYSVSGFGFDLRYTGTDIDEKAIFGGDYSDDKVVFTIKRAL